MVLRDSVQVPKGQVKTTYEVRKLRKFREHNKQTIIWTTLKCTLRKQLNVRSKMLKSIGIHLYIKMYK